MTTKKPVADPDIEPEYDFRNSVPNPYVERHRAGHARVVTGSSGRSGDAAEPLAWAACVRGATLIVSLVDGREVRVPVRWFPRLSAGSVATRSNVRIIEGGRALHWPDLDEDIGVESLLANAAPRDRSERK